MVENRPVLNIVSHILLIIGICIVALILYKVYTGRRSPEQVEIMQEAVSTGGL